MLSNLLSGRCSGTSGCSGTTLLLISHQADLVDTEFSDLVDNVHNVTITDAHTALDVDDTILLVLDAFQQRVYFFLQFLFLDGLLTQIVLAIFGNRNHDRRFLDDVLIYIRVVHVLGQSYRDSLLQEWRNHHEDDQQHKHDVDHWSDVNFRLYAALTAST